jgi:7-keto-8-aminopelargonate synthetase-like enzyme
MQELLPRHSVAGAGLAENARHANSAIFPWIVGDEQAALGLASALQSEGFLVPAIRYPTVAKGSARLRITVTASHKEDQIRSLCKAITRLSTGSL